MFLFWVRRRWLVGDVVASVRGPTFAGALSKPQGWEKPSLVPVRTSHVFYLLHFPIAASSA